MTLMRGSHRKELGAVFDPYHSPLERILSGIGWERREGSEHYLTLRREGTGDTERQKPHRGRVGSLTGKFLVMAYSGRKKTTPPAYSLSRQSVVVDAVDAAILDFYSGQDPDMRTALQEKFDKSGTFYVVTEAIDNSREYVPESDTLSIGLWLGRRGICLGFYDGGIFFARQDIKATFEGDCRDNLEKNVKLIVDEKAAKECEERESIHQGLLLMHRYSDQRRVEVRRRDGTELVVLYCMLTYNRLFPTSVPAQQ